MKVIDEIGGLISAATEKASKAYDYRRLDMKIRGYEKEIDQSYKKAGRILYEAWSTGEEANNGSLTEQMENISNLRFRIRQLNKNIAEMRSHDIAEAKTAADNKEAATYAKLSRKDDDLKISRTSEGIKILRNCPKCKMPNNSKAEACEYCGCVFSGKIG